MPPLGHRILRALNLVALVLATIWAFKQPEFESVLAAVVASSGLIAHYVVQHKTRQLSISFAPGKPYEQTEPAGAAGKALRYFSVAVKNTGQIDLDSCLVKITSMKAIDGEHFENVFLPIALITQQQQLQGRPGGRFHLRCGETKHVRVVAMNELDETSEIVLAYEDPNIPNLVRRGSFQITLEAFGGDQPSKMLLKVSVGPDGVLRVQKYGSDIA